MKKYIKDELKAIESALQVANKYNMKKIKNLLMDIKKIFEFDKNKNEIEAIYEKMPLIYVSLYCEVQKVKI